ncbi:NAD-dependent aldehyde dehydrogenase [Cladophialophora yegresii CBS 114405]|uniref:aldehyde dehydrogenase (NAD(+)) n=1 Tax=Cladophialophora yegresii CBS 114405 TaxID=1182544 RepID=W9VJP3_9EURO|nr:NAD-dependent aldehyde dehydrogenase [Cladophialophora yegresii CBS 114405]EXJ55877.1 NAD-dependent aldehyde dehydrogenase [Cladophialophora yegresii CBS 114405]
MPGEVITTISPTTNKPILTRHGLSPPEILQLGTTAQAAFKAFRKSHASLSSRQQIIAKALSLVLEKQDVLARELTEQMGRPIAYTAKEITTAVKRAEYMNSIAPEVLSQDATIPGQPEEGFKRYITRRDPVGVVLVIFAWNYPYLILVNSLIPALLAGCSVILKPSPQTPTVVEHVVDIFAQAGLPRDVIQYLHCGNPLDLRPLITSEDVNHICFTGSVAAGIAIQTLAATRVSCSVGLELGGKDPAYVRRDVDAAWAAEEIVDGAIFNSGQSCCAIERVYVHEDVYDKFVDAAKTILAGYRLGDPLDESTQLGPVVSRRAVETIRAQVADALAKGAKDETPQGVESFTSPQGPSEGNWVPPTLLTHVNHSMAVMREETFGPVIPVQKVGSDEEAIALMNDSQFGLTASIWTKDVARGEELCGQVEAGTVFVNRADFPAPDLAWTGWKDSGKGVTLSRVGFEQFVKVKSYHVKAYPR